MEEYLCILLSSFVSLQYKIHSLHSDITGPIFGDVHKLLDEIYQFFGDENIDLIKERVRILWEETPNNLDELLKLSTIKNLDGIPTITEALKIVRTDLIAMCDMIQQWEEEANDAKDYVTMNILTDFHRDIGKLEWRVRSTLWVR